MSDADELNKVLARVIALETMVFALLNIEKYRGDGLRQKWLEARNSLETALLNRDGSEAQLERIRAALDQLELVAGWKDQ